MQSSKSFNIAYISDPRLSREHAHIALRAITAMRSVANIQLIRGDLSEQETLELLSKQNYDLVLAPWYRYLVWTRIDGMHGLSRTSGPAFAGYFGDQVLPYETAESATILKSLLKDTTRSGLRPLLSPETQLYCESWTQGAGLGFRLDTLLALPEISQAPWSERSNALRICYSALWSLIFDEGPGKADLGGKTSSKTAKAWFQVGADSQALSMRLCYTLPGFKPRDALRKFRPEKTASPSDPAQLLLRYADLLRVHLDPETQDVEITASFFPSAPAEKYPLELHTLWIEPLSSNVVQEKPYAEITPPHLQAFVSHDALVAGALEKVTDLKSQIQERDELIRELRSGGLGRQAEPIGAPPEAESLLEAFQERFFDARFKIRQFQHELNRLSRDGAQPAEIFRLKKEMNELATRQKKWIATLAETLERYRAEKEAATPESDSTQPPPKK
jgi:hypothetical protein